MSKKREDILVLGVTGARGLPGPKGDVGMQGPAGTTGTIGPIGPTGPTGTTGPTGLDGNQGPTGSTGPTGPPGVDGPTGAPGADGPIYREYANFYYTSNTTTTVLKDTFIQFSGATSQTSGILINLPGAGDEITLVNEGLYELTFQLTGYSGEIPQRYRFYIDGFAINTPTCSFSIVNQFATTLSPLFGQAIIDTTTLPNGVLKIKCENATFDTNLPADVQSVSLMIKKLD